jgi:hypothetical protein
VNGEEEGRKGVCKCGTTYGWRGRRGRERVGWSDKLIDFD